MDIQATANFIKELLLVGGVRHRSIRVAVVANRVRSSTSVYEPLERFVASLNLSFLTRLLDSDVYIEAAETGRGIFEMDPYRTAEQRQDFLPLVRWVINEAPSEATNASNVVPIKHSTA
jgi:chromosome partitioning protein